VRQYQFVQEAMDRVRLLVVPAGDVGDWRDQVQSNLERLLGDDVTVVVEMVSQIPREPSGKHLIVKPLRECRTTTSGLTMGSRAVAEETSP
jgi:hypothetical protein